jgi:predicted Zn-dependent protease
LDFVSFYSRRTRRERLASKIRTTTRLSASWLDQLARRAPVRPLEEQAMTGSTGRMQRDHPDAATRPLSKRSRTRRVAVGLVGFSGGLLVALCLAAPMALFASGCGGGGTGKKKDREIILYTEAVDQKVGRDVATQVREQMGIVDDPQLADFVRDVGRRIARNAPRQGFNYVFSIVDQEVPNAFAVPGGYIYVSRGLLGLANSTDQIAGVIGHEIVHVAARHSAAQQAMMNTIALPFTFHSAVQIASFGRDQEREADRLGQALAGLAGYNPRGLAEFMRELEASERMHLGTSRLPSWLDSHPATTERFASAAARANVIQWQRKPGTNEDSGSYLRRLQGLVDGMNASQGVIEGERFLHPGLGFSMLFPDRWLIMNSPQAVGAISPKRNAQVFLEHQGLGIDPRLSADEYLKKVSGQGFNADKVQSVKIGDFDGWRVFGGVATPGGRIHVVFTWISYNSSIYRITGVTLSKSAMPAILNVSRSFRPLTPEQRASIHEVIIHIATARASETLDSLSERTDNAWNVQRTAVMNGMFTNDILAKGQFVKIGRRIPYPSPDAR